jgi:hypothetical protein
VPWPTPLIQLAAFSEEQTDNVYRPLQSMIGRIDVVTSSAKSGWVTR